MRCPRVAAADVERLDDDNDDDDGDDDERNAWSLPI
jgi:hypothetical protein